MFYYCNFVGGTFREKEREEGERGRKRRGDIGGRERGVRERGEIERGFSVRKRVRERERALSISG